MGRFPSKTRCIGILTAGGDCPGLNAAIRGITKAAIQDYGIRVVGILDGFRGLVENRTRPLESRDVSGVMTLGGTILGTARDKLHKMPMGGKVLDMTRVAVENAHNNGFDCVVCLGGGGTQKNALQLQRAGLNVLTLPKTIDNDVALTDVSFGFDTAMEIATQAIDRLHTTATSHDRIIIVETMGHDAGWLALGAGIAGGADIVLIPEIPYELEAIGDFLLERQKRFGKKFSIVAVAERAKSRKEAEAESGRKKKAQAKAREAASDPEADSPDFRDYKLVRESLANRLARQLQVLTRTEARVTSLGHVQRGGVPSAADRLLATTLGVKAAELLAAGHHGVMVALQGGQAVPVPLEQVAGVKNLVPLDHPWICTARRVGTHMGVSDDRFRALLDQASQEE
ncbi:MAG: 6-phosphofructokinase [Candidatus Krumholzibacteriia bacterium]